jgi:phage-related protein
MLGSAGVLEVVEDRRGNAYRAVYIATPKPDVDLIKERLKAAATRAKELEDE